MVASGPKSASVLDLVASLVLITITQAAAVLEDGAVAAAEGEVRVKREDEATGLAPESSSSPAAEVTTEAPSKEAAISLGEILGLLFLVCCIIYCIGIGYKIVKIIKGTYVEEEPVFMKYK